MLERGQALEYPREVVQDFAQPRSTAARLAMSRNLEFTLDELARAFPQRPLGAAHFPALQGKTWRELSAQSFGDAVDVLDRVGPTEIFELAPALLAALIRDTLGRPPKYVARDAGSLELHLGTCAGLTRKPRNAAAFDLALGTLNPRQQHVIALVLTAIEMELSEPSGWTSVNLLDRHVAAALDSYWRALVTDDERVRIRHQMTEPSRDLAQALRALDEAFPARPLDSKIFRGPKGPVEGDEAFRSSIAGRSWRDLPVEFLRVHDEILEKLTPRGVTELLPAFLRARLVELLDRGPFTAAGPDPVLPALSRDATDRQRSATFDQRFADLSGEQRRAIAITLSALERSVENDDRSKVRQTLDSYWRQFLPAGESS